MFCIPNMISAAAVLCLLVVRQGEYALGSSRYNVGMQPTIDRRGIIHTFGQSFDAIFPAESSRSTLLKSAGV